MKVINLVWRICRGLKGTVSVSVAFSVVVSGIVWIFAHSFMGLFVDVRDSKSSYAIIHKLREYNYYLTKDMTPEERRNYYNERGRAFQREIEAGRLRKETGRVERAATSAPLAAQVLPSTAIGT